MNKIKNHTSTKKFKLYLKTLPQKSFRPKTKRLQKKKRRAISL